MKTEYNKTSSSHPSSQLQLTATMKYGILKWKALHFQIEEMELWGIGEYTVAFYCHIHDLLGSLK